MMKKPPPIERILELGPEDLYSSPVSTETNYLTVHSLTSVTSINQRTWINHLCIYQLLKFYTILIDFTYSFPPPSLCSRHVSLLAAYLWLFFPVFKPLPMLFSLPGKCLSLYLSSDLIFRYHFKYHFLSKAFHEFSI